MSAELKPCPFCSDLPVIDPANSYYVEHPRKVGCPLTFARMSALTWNTRAPDPREDVTRPAPGTPKLNYEALYTEARLQCPDDFIETFVSCIGPVLLALKQRDDLLREALGVMKYLSRQFEFFRDESDGSQFDGYNCLADGRHWKRWDEVKAILDRARALGFETGRENG